jgi:hypothetical protein
MNSLNIDEGQSEMVLLISACRKRAVKLYVVNFQLLFAGSEKLEGPSLDNSQINI